MKFGKIHCLNVCDSVLEIKTSSMAFYGFLKITIYRDLAICNSWHLLFLIFSYLTFQK